MFLAWLIPGAGHIYQGRYGKGLLYMICILGAFYQGMYLGGNRVVYASWKPEEKRLAYLCQVGAGLPALPAIIQSYRVNHNLAPLAGGYMAPPANGQELASWEKSLNRGFELGTAYTMIAGLLNILVICDAWGGPMLWSDEKEERKRNEQKKERAPPASQPAATGPGP
jgi:hypothetical protein